MAWPDDLTRISSNLSTTELWVLKEQMGGGDWEMVDLTGFGGYTSWMVILHGIKYECSEHFETISTIYRR